MRVVITGFGPLGEEAINPIFEAVKRLPAEITGAEVVRVEVPTVFDTSGGRVAGAIGTHQPDMVIYVGRTGGHETVTVEKMAINLAEARTPDNAGQQPSNVLLVEGGTTAYPADLPIKVMVENCHDHQLSAVISYTARTFVCNGIMYYLLHLANTKYPTIRGGFTHVPFLPGQTTDKPTLAPISLGAVIDSLFYMTEVTVKMQEGIQLQGGAAR